MGILNPTLKFAAHFRVRRSAHTLPFGALCMVRTPCLMVANLCAENPNSFGLVEPALQNSCYNSTVEYFLHQAL